MLRPTALIFGLLLLPAGLTAQAPSADAAGTRLRIVTAERTVIGTLMTEETDSIVVRTESGSLASVRRADVRRMEESLGMKSNRWPGAAAGAGIGMAIGIVLGSTADAKSTAFRELEKAGQIVTYGSIGLGAGLVAGFAIGSLTRSERWRQRPADAGLVVTRSGAGVRLWF